MGNPHIPRDDVHRWSEEAADAEQLFKGTATRLLRGQKRLLNFYNKNLPATDGQTGEVSIYLLSVVIRIYDRAGGRLNKVNGAQINAAASKIGGMTDALLPFDDDFPSRVREVADRAQPHILDEALWALFERDEKKDGEVNVDPEQAGLIFLMLWVATEALDQAWKPPKGFEGVDAQADEA